MTTTTESPGAMGEREALPPLPALSKRDRHARIRVLQAGLIACYEIIDGIRKELAELEAVK